MFMHQCWNAHTSENSLWSTHSERHQNRSDSIFFRHICLNRLHFDFLDKLPHSHWIVLAQCWIHNLIIRRRRIFMAYYLYCVCVNWVNCPSKNHLQTHLNRMQPHTIEYQWIKNIYTQCEIERKLLLTFDECNENNRKKRWRRKECIEWAAGLVE